MPITKLLGITQATATQQANQTNKYPEVNFAKNAFNFENANPNRPESRDEVHGKILYCLA